MKTVSIQGTAGSYSEEAAGILMNEEIRIIECRTFPETFSAVIKGDADHAVVPLRNKIVGEIHAATSALRNSGLHTTESLELQVRHVLAAIPGAAFKSLTHVFSHPEAIKQCSRFFRRYESLRAVNCDDTATGIRDVVHSNEPFKAAIGSERAALMYGGEILRRDIADDNLNLTAFYLVGK